ncbi:MAG: acyl carrier protein [Salinivirgaceae bacterium]|nr:acyl carrier protein [Salinivirgaceae bacterium]MDD4748152.1 acyl carrier protein [Salinivirgaceae bacterium]
MEKQFIENFKETLEIEGRELYLTDKFRDYSEWDSLAYLSVVAMLDEEYSVIVETADFKKLITINDLIEEVKKRK